jgi:hypothetical protein
MTKRNMSTQQEVAIVDKYVKDHPNEWDKAMVGAVYNALDDACEEDDSLHDKSK